MTTEVQRDILAGRINAALEEWDNAKPGKYAAHVAGHVADNLVAAGYRKAERVTEYGTVFNRRAVFLQPPAESVDVFKERYERETGWMLTERDPILTRTFLRCDPDPTEPVLHAREVTQ